MKLLLALSALLASVLTVRGACTVDFSTLCSGVRCSSSKDCNVKVPDPCGDCKKFYTCAAQGRRPGIFPVSELPETCPCGLCFSAETRGCHVSVPETCPTQVPLTETHTVVGISCFRAGNNYVNEYQEAGSSDYYIEIANGIPITRQCPPGTYFVFDVPHCQCMDCPDPMPAGKVCSHASDNDFCIDFDDASLLKGLYVDRLSDFPTTTGRRNLGGYFDGSSSLAMLYFANNQRSQFTWHLWFKRDASQSSGIEGLVCNGDDKHAGSMDLLSDGSSTVRGSISTEPSHIQTAISAASATLLDGNFHPVAFVYNGTHLLLYIDAADAVIVDVNDQGLTDRNDCPLLIGQCTIASVDYYFKGVLDEICFYSSALSKERIDLLRTTSNYP